MGATRPGASSCADMDGLSINDERDFRWQRHDTAPVAIIRGVRDQPTAHVKGRAVPYVIFGNVHSNRIVNTERTLDFSKAFYHPIARGEELTPDLLALKPDPYFVKGPAAGGMPEIFGEGLWRGARGQLGRSVPFFNYLFCSDELAKRIKGAGIEGWRFRRCKLKSDS